MNMYVRPIKGRQEFFEVLIIKVTKKQNKTKPKKPKIEKKYN